MPANLNALEALDRLRAGNARFASHVISIDSLTRHLDRASLMKAQQPFAILLGCSDSRAPAELVFDQGLGDLFVIRVAGNVVSPSQVGSVVLDTKKRSLVRGTVEVTLTAREFALANELWSHGGDVLSRSRLLSSVWGTDFEGSPNVVDVYVGYLRAKIDQLAGGGVSLQTVRGIGYRLVADSGAEGARK